MFTAEYLNQQIKVDSKRIRSSRESVLKTLRNHGYGRTNQFDVQAKLDGLDEKFRVLNNEPLADALKSRLKKLERIPHRWKPEALSLLLCLSDHPVTRSRIGDVDLSRPIESPPSLTWAEIIAEDPLNEEGLWDGPDYADDSSVDAHSLVSEDSPKVIHDKPPSADEEGDLPVAERHFVDPDYAGLEDIREGQFWRQRSLSSSHSEETTEDQNLQQITELQAIRECLFMLVGLPTYLFEVDAHIATVHPSSRYSIERISSKVLQHCLLEFAKIGTILNSLRRWLQRVFTVPVLQTFHYAVESRLRLFQQAVGRIEQRFVSSLTPVVVSLQAVLTEVQSNASYLLDLAGLLALVPSETQGPHHACLELLYKQACELQMRGNMEGFDYFARIFFECLQTYLRLVRRWMEDGEIDPNDRTFFVCVANQDCEASSLWLEQYDLREDSDREIHAPTFVQKIAQKIFNTGKSVAFLKAIGAYEESNDDTSGLHLNYESVCKDHTELSIAPFSEVFPIAFEQWVKHRYHSSVQRLHEQLDQECGLWKTLDAYEYVYFSKDGSTFQKFASSIFDRVEQRKIAWNDRYILTDVAQSAFTNIPAVEAQRFTIRTRPSKTKETISNTSDLSTFAIDYSIPWPIMNIVRKPALAAYQRIFTFLLQLQYAKHHLFRLEFGPPAAVLNGCTRLAYSLRQRLLWCINTVHTYITDTVLATSTAQMRRHLAAAEDVDAMIEIHQTYIAHLMAQCLLTRNLDPIHQAIRSVLDLCIVFFRAQRAEAQGLVRGRSQGSPGSLSDNHAERGGISARPVSRTSTSTSEDEESDVDERRNLDNLDALSTGRNLPYSESLGQMIGQFSDLHRFVVDGLRGVSRAGGEISWGVLAEKLEWK
ncbi:MAG: hypothetical protein M1821_007738 [Bathelium mastoideum]|nr:MAG: hypothetical protein M1821_007738 [Bathelium mastoideum]